MIMVTLGYYTVPCTYTVHTLSTHTELNQMYCNNLINELTNEAVSNEEDTIDFGGNEVADTIDFGDDLACTWKGQQFI